MQKHSFIGHSFGGGGSSVEIADNLTTNDAAKALSAKQGVVLNQLISDMRNLGRYLAVWDATTGLPTSFPLTTPYAYQTGDYFRVGAVGATNYTPNGSSYTGAASTVTYSGSLAVGDLFFYDGSGWYVMKSGGGVSVRSVLDSPMAANTIYTLGSVSTLSATLPSGGSAGDEISVEFTASAAFTPTVGGTYSGETPFAATSGKRYVYVFAWLCGGWVLSILEF